MTDNVEDTREESENEDTQTQTIDELFDADTAEQVEETDDKTEDESEESDDAEDESEDDAETTSAREESVPVKALTEERRKRQSAEKRVKELEGQLRPKDKIPDPIDDPEGYVKYNEKRFSAEAFRTKANLSRDVMIDTKDDYIEKEAIFVKLAKERPYLKQQMMEHPNPAKFAYNTALEHLEIEKYRDPDYREKLKAELREEILKEKGGKPAKKSALDVPDLTKAAAAGKNSDSVEKEETLDDMFEGSPL